MPEEKERLDSTEQDELHGGTRPDLSIEKEEEKVDWEARYKELQSFSDRKIADKENELKLYEELLSPHKENITQTEEGKLVFDFSKTEKSKETKAPQLPTQDEWVDSPDKAAEKYYNYREYVAEQKRLEKEQESQLEKMEVEYKQTRAKNWEAIQKEYPDVSKADSELRKEAQKYLDEHQSILASPECDVIATQIAAMKLKILPTETRGGTQHEDDSKTKKDRSYIISGGSRSGGNPKGELSDEEFAKLGFLERQEYMRKQVLGNQK